MLDPGVTGILVLGKITLMLPSFLPARSELDLGLSCKKICHLLSRIRLTPQGIDCLDSKIPKNKIIKLTHTMQCLHQFKLLASNIVHVVKFEKYSSCRPNISDLYMCLSLVISVYSDL